MKCIKFTHEEKRIKDFLDIPNKIYNKKNNTEDRSEVEQLLKENHILSNYFKLDKFLIYKNDIAVGRFVITTYKNDNNAYLGFFECIDDKKVAKFLFDSVYEFCKEKKYKKIVGPVDASFWLRYRLKVNMFDNVPYTSEPYNASYYYKFFKENKFIVSEVYSSNIYKAVKSDYDNKKYSDRYKLFEEQGYKIVKPNMKDYESIVEKIYYMIIKLYNDFPIYKDISLDDFQKLFSSYRKIINPNMIKLCYFKEELVGFFIGIPNYNNMVYHLNNPLNVLKILKIKHKPKEYVMLYIGVNPEHKGLGKALIQSVMMELRKNNLPCIGALAKDGKVTQKYFDDMIEEQYKYVLLERKIK